MKPSRRSFLKYGAISLAAPAIVTASPGLATAPKAGKQAPGIYRQKIGAFEVTAILDGTLLAAAGLFQGYDEDAATAALARQHLPASPDGQIIPVIGYLVNTGDRLIAIDSGTNDSFAATLGNYHDVLAASGVTSDQIDHVIATHLHVDHIGGLTDGQGHRRFANADLIAGQVEWDFWHSDDARAKVPESVDPFFEIARTQTAPYADAVRLVGKDQEVFPGIEMVNLPGHTPGHMGVHLRSEGEELLIWGDIVHATKLQFDNPDWTIAFDSDPDQARATRKRLLDQVATDGVAVAGMHMDFPGFGHVVRHGSAYRFEPMAWRYSL